MKLKLSSMKKTVCLLQIMLIAAWITNLADTEAFFLTYALCAAVALACLFDNYHHSRQLSRLEQILSVLMAMLFSIAVTASNYALFSVVRDPHWVSAGANKIINLLNAGCTLLGGFFAAYHVMWCLISRLPLVNDGVDKKRNHSGFAFWIPFAAISVLNILYLFFVTYPGSMSVDSIHQLEQIRDGVYSNHHPFWHTMVIKLFMGIGYAVFGDPNKAAAVYFIAQILMMAAAFAYVMMTLYQAGVPKLWIGLSFAVYAFMPYNTVYSCTMWKDVLFGGAVCVFLTATFRILKGIGKKQLWNYILFAVSGLGFCLWRSNGFLAILASLVLFAIVLWKDQKKLLLVMLAVVAAGWVMKGPVLDALNVTDPDLVESLSIPVQQVARVITDGCPLTEEETEILDKVMDLERVPELYDKDLSDPIKNEIRRKDNEYFEANIGQYLKLWLQLLVRYPGEYVKAWIDQTNGYWGGGYYNWIFGEFVEENDMGLSMTMGNSLLFKINRLYFGMVRNLNWFQPLHSIGLHVWLLAIFCVVNLLKKRREWLLSIPLLMIVLTLMVATPVATEFRYAYAIFTSFPLVACVSLNQRKAE